MSSQELPENLRTVRIHNQFCRDDWDMYHGAGPREMGPANDGCVCSMSPPGYREVPPGYTQGGETIPREAIRGLFLSIPDYLGAQEYLTIDEVPTTQEPPKPKLWDKRPDSVTHIAGGQLNIHGRYLRQRCDWCGIILVEYDLERVAVPVGQPFLPAMWSTGALVRIDGHMSAEVEAVEESPGVFKLPMDSCTFDPETQVK